LLKTSILNLLVILNQFSIPFSIQNRLHQLDEYPRGFPPIFLKIGEVQPNLDFQPKLDFIMW
jgi:hypothetical protein